MTDPEVLNNLPVEDLELVAARYPYFSAVQVLLARAYRDKNDYRYSGKLQQAAVVSNNRRQLFELVRTRTNQSILSQEIPVSRRTPTIVPSITPGFSEPTEATSVPATGNTSVEAKSAETTKPETQTISSKPGNDREGLSQLADVIMDEERVGVQPNISFKPERAAIEVISELPVAIEIPEEKNIPASVVEIEPVISATLSQEPIEQKPGVASTMDPLMLDIMASAVSRSIELDVSPEIEDPGITEIPVESSSSDTDPEQANSYSEWIYLRSRQIHYKEGGSQQVAGNKLPQTRSSSTEIDTGSNLEEPESQGTISHGSTRINVEGKKEEHQQELLERFIKTEPKITPGRVGEYSTADLARESLEEDLSMVTETMARMYVVQGKPEKAKRAYRKLMELHPEKSVYFAAQLKNLDKNKKA